jgi:hypothetical protein
MHYINTEESFDLVIHRIGNRSQDEDLHLSKTLTFYPAELTDTLYTFFLKPFKSEAYFHFKGKESVEENLVYNSVKNIFEEPTSLLQNSLTIAEHLYKVGGNPKMKGGELFVVFFPDALIEEEHVKVIGLFKTEHKDRILKAEPNENNYKLWTEEGILLSKIDKGCLIFNIEEEDGYVISLVDNGKGEEYGIWGDEFLDIKAREDKYFDTETTLNFCKSYVMDKMPEEFEVSRIDQADLLNKSMNFFKDNETFEVNDFAEQVLGQEELKNSFEDYKNKFEEVYEVELSNQFDISKDAVKKQARFFKSIIKLDKNFHIYVHGNRQMIEQGTDEEGKKFYKLYYNAEN